MSLGSFLQLKIRLDFTTIIVLHRFKMHGFQIVMKAILLIYLMSLTSAQDPCGGHFTEDAGYIRSPNYPEPYADNMECTWYITVPENYKVSLGFEFFEVESNQDFVKIRDGQSSTSPLLSTITGVQNWLPHIHSSRNKMVVYFRSDQSVTWRGFSAFYTKVIWGGNLTQDEGHIQSPNYPEPYGLNIDCTWYITVEDNYKVQINFEYFKLDFDELCTNDFVEISNGHESTRPLIRTFCGDLIPLYIHSSSNKIVVRFRSDSVKSNRTTGGFKAIFIKDTCGGKLVQNAGRIQSPNYPKPYGINLECTWFITVPENNKVNLTFESFELESNQKCELDYVEIRDGHEKESPVLGKFCNASVLSVIHSFSNKIAVTFRSDTFQSRPAKGFKAFFIKDTCGGKLIQDLGYIQSPNYPEPYGPNMDCTWYITVPEDYQVTLTFAAFEIDGYQTCDRDYLEIRDGHESNSSFLGRFCNARMPTDIHSSSNKISVKFRSDNLYHATGFKAFFIKDKDECKQSNHGCDHECINTRTGYRCECWPGFNLRSDRKTCEGDFFGPFAIQKIDQVTITTTSNVSTAKIASTSFVSVELTRPTEESPTDVTTKESPSFMSTEKPSLLIEVTATALKKAKDWILKQRHDIWGWGKNTPRAIVSLYFTDPKLFASESSDLKWMFKELELQLAFDLIRNETDPLKLGELSLYLNAFLTTCHSPVNINGFNLVQKLRLMTDHDIKSNNFISPSVFVTLCLAGVTSLEDIEKLEHMLKTPSKHLSAGTEALALMALTCIAKNPKFADSSRGYLHELLNSSLNKLVLSFHRNETSGNLYATALVAQALQANIERNQFDRMAAVQNLLSLQEPDGSFGNLLATYYVIPILAERSLLDLSLHCEHVVQTPEEMSPLSVLQDKGQKKIAVEYSLWHEKPSDFKYTVQLRVRAGMNFLSIMHLAQSQNALFRFKFEQLSTGVSVYSIGGVPNDEEQGLQWILYVKDKVSASNGSSLFVPFSGNINSLIPEDGDQVVFWYRHQQ